MTSDNFASSPHPVEGVTDDVQLMDSLKRIADAMIHLMGKSCEVAIHDFRNLKSSLVYLAGDVTGRKMGAPVSPQLFALYAEYGDAVKDRINYRTRMKGGRIVRSTTTFIRNSKGKVIGCFCMNHDVTNLLNMRDFLHEYSVFNDDASTPANAVPETSSIDFIDEIVRQAASDTGKQPAFMNKKERLDLVRMLEKNGLFRFKGAVEHAAYALGVTRYTVYNYLKEINKRE